MGGSRICLAAWLACLTVSGDDAIPFSHKRHAVLKLDCGYCHAGAKTGERAAYPAASGCMTCHVEVAKDRPAIRRLAALPPGQPIEPEHSVYSLAEFATFSHARHRAAKLDCARCHGNVATMEVVEQVLPMTMKACVGCHQESRATQKCKKCHALGQDRR